MLLQYLQKFDKSKGDLAKREINKFSSKWFDDRFLLEHCTGITSYLLLHLKLVFGR